ncbi:hypothetical protein [Actinomadura violacea]|uniref:Uncharacterized protein n=1 Tax=Actinomadura violacea TaxID=2819934 RepID=A0ABS3RYL4_9ACTN|nr:hypothetical protein [Actinomadura violacea]MBO2461736.1 hypothetical protein [Actinomadura violacea]
MVRLPRLPRAERPQHPRPDHDTWRPVLDAARRAVPADIADGGVPVELIIAGLLATHLQGAVHRDRAAVDQLYDIWADEIAYRIGQAFTLLGDAMGGDAGDPDNSAERQALHLAIAKKVQDRMAQTLRDGC